MVDGELAAAANANLLGSFAKLVERVADAELQEESGLFAFATRLPVRLFNGCVVHGPVASAALEDAVDWVRSSKVPFYIWIAESLRADLAGSLRRLGVGAEPTVYPNMVLHPIPDPPASPEDVRVEATSDAGAFVDFSVGLGSRRAVVERIFTHSFAADPDVRLFTACLGAAPAGTALAIRTGPVSGVYNVGVAEACRRRGVGTALTWATVDAGRAWGCDPIVLQSSTTAYSTYEAIGFRTVVRYLMFEGGGR